VYVAVAVLPDGTRDILGLWIEPTESAKLWLKVFTDLKTRGCHDILIAVADGVKGMNEALGAVFPETTLQTCIARLIRHSLDFASWKERRALAAALRPIYTAADADAALTALAAFERGPWGTRFPPVVGAWRRAWTNVIPVFSFPPEVRRVIYATNALESVRARLRMIIKARGYFQSDDAAATAIWLALRHITASRAAAYWKTAMNQFAMLYEDRFTKADI
jgi:putative transposase